MMSTVETESEADECSIYSFTQEDIDAVNPINWHETFKNVSPKAYICPIPPEVLKYLKSDGMMMPQDTPTTGHLNLASVVGAGRGDDEGDNISWASISSNEQEPEIPSEFLQNIRREQRKAPICGGRNNQESVATDLELDEAVEEEKWDCRDSSSSSSDDEDENGASCVVGRKKLAEVEKFREYDLLLDSNIKKLGGAVLPKINRKSPKDAMWIGFNRSLKCYNSGDIYLLLKTSDIVSQVLENPYKGCFVRNDLQGLCRAGNATGTSYTPPYMLILKQWDDSWGPEMEFRCFVCSNQLIAISQRDLDTCHSAVIKRKDKLLLNIQNFFIQKVQGRFPLEFYVMDIVCHPNGDIYIVDFDVFGLVTDPLLFTYRELRSLYDKLKAEHDREHLPSKWDENKVADYLSSDAKSESPFPHFGSPFFRFLTESRNFRRRKSSNHFALSHDVMTYIREAVAKK